METRSRLQGRAVQSSGSGSGNDADQRPFRMRASKKRKKRGKIKVGNKGNKMTQFDKKRESAE